MNRGGEEGPLPAQRPEMLHPQEMPTTYLGIGNRMGDPPEPLIKKLQGMVELAGLPAGHTTLVGRANCYPRC